MRMKFATLPVILGALAMAAPCFADSVAVTSGPNGTTVVNGKPCRVVTNDDHDGKGQNTTSVTTGPGGVSGTTSVSPGGNGTSVTVGSGSSSNGNQASSGAGSDCVIHKNK